MDSLNTPYLPRFPDFYQNMTADLERFQREGQRTASRENSILLSCVPWFSYTDVSFHPKSSLMFLHPMFVWGKYQKQGETVTLPFTLQVHHAAADGYHCHLLLSELEGLLARPESWAWDNALTRASFHQVAWGQENSEKISPEPLAILLPLWYSE